MFVQKVFSGFQQYDGVIVFGPTKAKIRLHYPCKNLNCRMNSVKNALNFKFRDYRSSDKWIEIGLAFRNTLYLSQTVHAS